jgi:hypothetical protein
VPRPGLGVSLVASVSGPVVCFCHASTENVQAAAQLSTRNSTHGYWVAPGCCNFSIIAIMARAWGPRWKAKPCLFIDSAVADLSH